jgi:hypothetical protein
MHEMAHAFGVGYGDFRAKVVTGVFTGAQATAVMRQVTGDPNAVVHSDVRWGDRAIRHRPNGRSNIDPRILSYRTGSARRTVSDVVVGTQDRHLMA